MRREPRRQREFDMPGFRRDLPAAAALILALADPAKAQEMVFLSCVAQTRDGAAFEEVWAVSGPSVFWYNRDSGELGAVCSDLACDVSDAMIRFHARDNPADGWEISRLTGVYRYVYNGATISEGRCARIPDPRAARPLF